MIKPAPQRRQWRSSRFHRDKCHPAFGSSKVGKTSQLFPRNRLLARFARFTSAMSCVRTQGKPTYFIRFR